jgi:hypothetical protein
MVIGPALRRRRGGVAQTVLRADPRAGLAADAVHVVLETHHHRGVIAIVIGKQVFGGIGQNPVNPAMVARVVLLISFPLEMTTFPAPHPWLTTGSPGILDSLEITFGAGLQADAVTSAIVLGKVKTAYRNRLGYQARLLGGFALISTALLIIGNLSTRPVIEERQNDDLRSSLERVVPASLYTNDLLENPLRIADTQNRPVTVYRGIRNHQVSAMAFRVIGYAYAGKIEVILGLDSDGKVLGVCVLSHARDDPAGAPWHGGQLPNHYAQRPLGQQCRVQPEPCVVSHARGHQHRDQRPRHGTGNDRGAGRHGTLHRTPARRDHTRGSHPGFRPDHRHHRHPGGHGHERLAA